MESSKGSHAIVGIFIFFGLLILLTGVLILGGQRRSFEKTITLNAIFDDVGGLLKGNNIWYAGVKIGTVKKIAIMDNGLADVQMKIDLNSKRYMKRSAQVKIGSDGLIGNRILIIYDNAYATDKTPVKDGDTLHTDMPLNAAEMMNTLQESNRNLSVITSDFKIVSRRLAGGEGSMGKLLTNDSIAVQLQATTALLHDISANLLAYTSKFQNRGVLVNEIVTDTTVFRKLKTIVADINQASINAKELTNNLNQVSYNLKDSSNVAGVLLHDQQAAANIRTAIDNIQSGTKKFDEDMEALQHNFLFRGFFRKRAKHQQKKN
jgi:phospholipid/cholesterol/gamma-HCH transport system substrate-binding protein